MTRRRKAAGVAPELAELVSRDCTDERREELHEQILLRAGERVRAARRTTRAALMTLDADLTRRSRAILVRKNRDYGRSGDGLENFRLAAQLAGVTPAQAVLARLGDKLARLRLAATGAELAVEDDDIPDARNLLSLLAAALREERGP